MSCIHVICFDFHQDFNEIIKQLLFQEWYYELELILLHTFPTLTQEFWNDLFFLWVNQITHAQVYLLSFLSLTGHSSWWLLANTQKCWQFLQFHCRTEHRTTPHRCTWLAVLLKLKILPITKLPSHTSIEKLFIRSYSVNRFCEFWQLHQVQA